MKIKLFAAIFAALAVVSCSSEPGDMTKIKGTISDPEITAARVTLYPDLDTTVNVVDGKFSVEVPASLEKYGTVILMVENQGKYGSYYVSDGTELNITLDKEDMKIVSSVDYIEAKYIDYIDALNAIYETEGDTMEADLENLWYETVKANPDNAISVLVLMDSMDYIAPEKMQEMLSLIQEPIRNSRSVSNYAEKVKAQLNTKEGVPFVDFEVEHVYGYDRSADPQPLTKTVKFSDYVGKGKYVLVDFWSPWCGPCRKEVPNIQKVYNEYKGKGLEVLSIAVWERKPQSHTIETAAELGMDWHHINNAQRIPTDIYGINSIPHLILIGPDGTILKRGFYGLEGIEAAVSEYIK